VGGPVVVAGVGMIPFSTPRNSGPYETSTANDAQPIELTVALDDGAVTRTGDAVVAM
jgi:hypothetical protein